MAGDGNMAKYKDVIQLNSDYHRVLTLAPAARRRDLAAVHDDGMIGGTSRRRRQCRFPQSSFDNPVEKGSSGPKTSASAAAQSNPNAESHDAIHDADDPQGLRDCGARHDAGPQGR
ncbi:MAG: hypothetical protein ACT4QB_05520 [Gammaproteobacteria bacterium]